MGAITPSSGYNPQLSTSGSRATSHVVVASSCEAAGPGPASNRQALPVRVTRIVNNHDFKSPSDSG